MSADDIWRTRLQQLVPPVDQPAMLVEEIERRQGLRARRHSSHRRTMAICGVVVIGLAVSVGVLRGGAGRDEVVVGEGAQALATLQVPPLGEARGDELDDGRPVWTIHHLDGEVSVLDAVSAHRPYGAGHLVGWCEDSRSLEDPQYGSVYDEHGSAVAGPAPAGLTVYRTSTNGAAVAVVGPPSDQARTPGRPGPPVAASCLELEPTSPHEGYAPGTLQMHPVGRRQAQSVDSAMQAAEGSIVLVHGGTIRVSGEGAVACSEPLAYDGTGSPACNGARVDGLMTPSGIDWAVLDGEFFARVVNSRFVDVTYVDGYSVRTSP